MKNLFPIILGLALWLAPKVFADDTQLYIFKASATLPVTYIVQNKIMTKTLAGKDLVNLTLGRTLTHPVDAKTEILALAVGLGNTPTHRVIIYDSTALTPAAKIKAEVVTLTSLDYDKAYVGANFKGQGIGTGKLLATAAGDPAKFGFPADIPLSGAAIATQVRGDGFVYDVPTFAFTLKGVNAHVTFKTTDTEVPPTTTTISGVVLKGTFSAGGKRLDVLPVPP